MSVSPAFVYDTDLWNRLLKEIREWEDQEADPQAYPRSAAKVVRRQRDRMAYEAIKAGIPTAVYLEAVPLRTIKGVWRRVERHCAREGLEVPKGAPHFERPTAAATYDQLVQEYGVLYDAWAEALTIAREKADNPVLISRVAYFAREGGLPYACIAKAVGYSTSGIRNLVVQYAAMTNRDAPRTRSAITARPGKRRPKPGTFNEPPGWLMTELRKL